MSNIIKLRNSTLIHGDTIEAIRNIETESIGFSMWSPPFPELYVYNNDVRDLANSRNYEEFLQHIGYLFPDMFRVMQQGRNVAIHCMDVPIQKGKHGFIGLRDFSGMLREGMESAGFIYHSRITIWKNPVTEMQRTKALGLLHKQIKKDSTMSRVGIPDYILIFRKDGERNNPVRCGISVDTWQQFASPVWRFDDADKDIEMILPLLSKDKYFQIPASVRNKYAAPVWMDVDYGNTLNAAMAREEKDEKHICPLQLDSIERATILYSNPGDMCLTNFMGIGSEPFQWVKMGRKAIGIELKKTYFDIAVKNVRRAELESLQVNILETNQ